MNKILKAAIVVLMLTAMPLKSWAQTPYRQYAEEGILLDFYELNNIDFRLYLLYNLSQDDRFVLIPETEYGQFVLTPKDENSHFMDEFEHFYQNVTADFALLTKNDIFEHMNEWKEEVAPQNFVSITMDVALRNSRVDNDHCANSLPFCTTDLIEFEAACTSQTANEPGMDDGCIGSSYNPSFYHMRIRVGGQFIIHMEGHDPNTSQGRDVDFCMWGPYTEEDVSSGWACTHLTGDKIIDCNYSADPTEDVYLGYHDNEHQHTASHGTINYHLPEIGEYYILMITNYSQQPCVITFTKTPGSGPGETDCDILPGIVSNDGPYCEGETIHLTVNHQMNATYYWTGPNGFTSTEQNPTIPNCTLDMAGVYTCVTTVGSQSTTASTVVEIYQQAIPSFTATTVCQGETTQFNGMATGQNVANYDWDFGDGETDSGQNVSHTYAQAGDYQVTLFVSAEDGSCPAEITQTVTVNAMPVPTVTASPSSVIYGGVATLTANVTPPGNYTFHWEPANMVTNPNSQTTQTVPIQETVVFTVTVTNTQGDCTSTEQVVVSMAGSDLAATATADQYEICEDGSTTLHALPQNGTGIYTFEWTPADLLNSSTVQHPVATPPVGTTTFTCTVSDGLTTQIVHVSIVVLPKNEKEIFETVCDQFIWNPQGHTIIETDHQGDSYTTSGLYHRTYINQYGCDSLVWLNLTVNNKHTEATKSFNSECDVIPFNWFDTIHNLEENGIYSFYGETVHGCDSAMTVTVSNMRYSPQPSHIHCTDTTAVVFGPYNDTIAVVTSTEFFSFQYNFKVEETGHSACVWDTCEWIISKPSWDIEPKPVVQSSNGMYESECMVYVADRDDDYVILTAIISNGCNSIERRFYLKSSFLGLDEKDEASGEVSIVPNPNNGQMRINFENMEGKTAVKVFDMTGNHIDAFETNVSTSRQSYDYTLKKYAEGIYFFVISNNNQVFTKKVVIIR